MEPVTITPYRDGPLLVRGPVELRDQDGNPIARPDGVIALCRCGKSRQAPFCDSSHKLAGFNAASAAQDLRPGASRPAGGAAS